MNIEDVLVAVKPWDCLKDATVELPALIEAFRGCSTILEIGTYKGATAAALALALPEARVTTVDLPDTSKAWNNAQANELCGIAIRALGLTDRIEQLRMDSSEIDLSRDFDGVFVDGDHSTEAVFRDLCTASLVGARVIVAHDYTEAKDFINPSLQRPPWTVQVHDAVKGFLQFSPEFKFERLPGWLVALRRGE